MDEEKEINDQPCQKANIYSKVKVSVQLLDAVIISGLIILAAVLIAAYFMR